MTGTLPLDGMRVVELSSFVATPLGGMTLAQLGADVIRVDQVGGGPDIDRWPLAPSGRSLYWAGLNKGKRSVTVDLRSAEGREVAADLVAECGVVLTNAPPRPGLTYDELSAVRADLIHVQLQGTREGGNAVDYTVNAATGFPSITGPSGQETPVNHALPAWDVACGLYMAIGLLAAERHRLRTGEGQRLQVALQDVALATAGNLGYLAEAQLGESRPRLGNHLFGDFGRDFATADGRVMVAVLTARHWRDLVDATGLGEVAGALERALGADFRRAGDRYGHREALGGVLAHWFASRTCEQVADGLKGASVLWSRYRDFAEVAAGLHGEPLMAPLDQPGIGTHLAPGSPVRLGDASRPPDPAPLLGEHTDQVLRDVLSLPRQRIEALRANGAVGGP
ncbi:2-methylfumaryl-CoA isomerase [Actinomadura darangshiensis]|uniref:2-methylfumaryl-CoA isomerase n=1 Tax=Actinomadura darangshiensis TaxID=705336 RepID=A0A4R5C1N4_9ACTN|nr:CoA transferase [Actinomadura darangshiensis]TDD90704.1 2-methylfumaryl-CoA isomerase [Actinomadura darangshiensis]